MPAAGSLAIRTFLASGLWKMVGTACFSHSLHLWGATEEDNHSMPLVTSAMLDHVEGPGPTCKPVLT